MRSLNKDSLIVNSKYIRRFRLSENRINSGRAMLAPTRKLRFYVIVGATIGRPKDLNYSFSTSRNSKYIWRLLFADTHAVSGSERMCEALEIKSKVNVKFFDVHYNIKNQ